MKTLEQMEAEHAAALEKLRKEHALAALAPIPPRSVQLTTAKLGDWLSYDCENLWQCLDIMHKFVPIPFYEFKGTFTRFVPVALNIGRDAGEERGGPFIAQIDTSQGEDFGPTVCFKFFAMLGETVCQIRCNLARQFQHSFGQYGASFQAHSGGRSRILDGNRYIAGSFRANTKLSAMMDKSTLWGSGSAEACSFSYTIGADDEDGEWHDAGLRLENLAEAMHGPRPLYRFEFDGKGLTGHFVRLEDGAKSETIAGDEAWKLYNANRYNRREDLEAAAGAVVEWSADLSDWDKIRP